MQQLESFLNFQLIEFAGVTLTTASLLTLIAVVLVTLTLIWLLERMVQRGFEKRSVESSLIVTVRHSVRYLLMILGTAVALEQLGVNLREKMTAAAGVLEEYLDIHFFTLSGTDITLGTTLFFLLALALTFLASRILQGAAKKAFHLRGVTDEGTVGTAGRLIHYTVLVIGLGISLQNIGINLSALFAAGALFAVALGFAMQNITQNFISGLILLVERTIKPGDILNVDGKLIRVSNMGIRATVGRTMDDEEIIIPNSILVQNSVTNYTMQDRQVRLRAEVGVVYSSNMKRVREVLEETAKELDWRLDLPTPRILLKRFGSSSVDFEVSVWIDNPWRLQQRRSDLHEAIWFALLDVGITIAFPQVDVHLDPEVSESISRFAGR